MMQIELRINGVLVDYIDVVNSGDTCDGLYIYRVSAPGKRRCTTVLHKQSDGARVLARLVLESLTTRRNVNAATRKRVKKIPQR